MGAPIEGASTHKDKKTPEKPRQIFSRFVIKFDKNRRFHVEGVGGGGGGEPGREHCRFKS